MTTSMTTSGRRGRTGWVATGALAVLTLVTLALPGSADATTVPSGTKDGLMCETGEGAAGPGDTYHTYNLDATAGYISTPDGNSIYMWSYTGSGRGFQLPGPTLCVTSGEKITVVLHDALREDSSIVFPGQQGVTADGQPAQPVLDASNTVTSLVQPATANGGTVTYTFTAGAPGTYLYYSGTDTAKQREMGLYGGLVVRPKAGPATDIEPVTGAPDTTFDASTEYLYILGQIDPDLHAAVERNRAYTYTKSVARYFTINGRSMPDTIAPNNAEWLPAQPYGALIHIKANATHPALIRYLNAGPISYPFHPHGSSELVVSRDGAPSVDAAGNDTSYLKFLVDVGPGQGVDTLERWDNVYDQNGKTTADGGSCTTQSLNLMKQDVSGECASIPGDIQLPQLQDQIVGPGTETWFSENPYLGAPGGQGPIPNGMVQNNLCGEYYHVAHSHALEQSTNFGASFGGMMTLIRIDPPGSNGCPA